MFRSSYSAKLEKQQDKNLEKLIEKRAKLKEKLASFLSKDRTVTLKFSRSDPYIGFTETRHKFDVNGLEEKAAEKMAEKVLKNAEEKDYWCILSRNKGTSVCDYSGNMKELDGFEDIDRGTPVGIKEVDKLVKGYYEGVQRQKKLDKLSGRETVGKLSGKSNLSLVLGNSRSH